MKTEKNILIAFILNLVFSVVEIVGGLFTGSAAILSDAMHDMGDAVSIGVSYWCERMSRKAADERYTYGYGRYSVLGSVITTLVLIGGSIAVLCNAVNRLIHPTEIHSNGMIALAVLGIAVNFIAARVTHGGASLNQKAVNLHILEDVFGWIVVLVGAVVMKWTNITCIDPLMSIGVAVTILISAVRHWKEAVGVFLEKAPNGIDAEEIVPRIRRVDGVCDVHHIHVWSMDGQNHAATLHVVVDGDPWEIKETVRNILAEQGICHATIETEINGEPCRDSECRLASCANSSAHHHHHHG